MRTLLLFLISYAWLGYSFVSSHKNLPAYDQPAYIIRGDKKMMWFFSLLWPVGIALCVVYDVRVRRASNMPTYVAMSWRTALSAVLLHYLVR